MPLATGASARLAASFSSHGRRPLPRARLARMTTRAQSFFGVDVSKLPLVGGLFQKQPQPPATEGSGDDQAAVEWARTAQAGKRAAPAEAPEGQMLATFAAGCFWGPQILFDRVPGVLDTKVGYTQGDTINPTYEQVCSGRSGHTEAIRVVYDPKIVTFDTLMDEFFSFVDPTTLNRQGGDFGTQYRSGIYCHNDEQMVAAEARCRAEEAKINKKVVVEVLPAADFYIAESYHQDYLANGGRFGMKQSVEKGCTDKIRCYG